MTHPDIAIAEQPDVPVRAGWWRRFFAWLYEILLLVPVLMLAGIPSLAVQAALQAWWLGGAVDGVIDTPLAHALNFIWLVVISFIYFSWCWRRGGQTLAMKTWRVRIARWDDTRVSWRAAAVRFAVAFVCWMPLLPLWMLARREPEWIPYAWFSLGLFVLPFCWAVADRDKQLLHDRLAGTRLLFAPKRAKPAS